MRLGYFFWLLEFILFFLLITDFCSSIVKSSATQRIYSQKWSSAKLVQALDRLGNDSLMTAAAGCLRYPEPAEYQ